MITKVYIHSDRDSMYEAGEKLGLSGEALTTFSHAVDEIELTLRVNPKTGKAIVTHLEGQPILLNKNPNP